MKMIIAAIGAASLVTAPAPAKGCLKVAARKQAAAEKAQAQAKH